MLLHYQTMITWKLHLHTWIYPLPPKKTTRFLRNVNSHARVAAVVKYWWNFRYWNLKWLKNLLIALIFCLFGTKFLFLARNFFFWSQLSQTFSALKFVHIKSRPQSWKFFENAYVEIIFRESSITSLKI